MAVSAKLYGAFFTAAFNKEIDLNTDTVKFMLVNSSYTPDQDAHNYIDDVVANEVTGTNWAAGGVVVDNVTVTYDSGTNVVKIDADDISETTVTVANARYGILYVDTGTDSTSPLILYVDFDGDQSATAGTVAITWHANGAATVTVG